MTSFLWSIAVFFISFFTIAGFWYENKRIFETMREGDHLTVVMNFVSRYISSPTTLEPAENKMFLNLLFASLNAAKISSDFNTLIMIVEKFNDLPAWFFYNNPNVRTISIPNPDKELRSIFIEKEYLEFREKPELEKIRDKFIDVTDGLKHRELKELRSLYQRLLVKNPDTELLDAVNALIPRHQMGEPLPIANVVLARLGNEAGIIGAAMLGR